MGAPGVLQLQQLVGNQAVTEMIQRSAATGQADHAGQAIDSEMDDGCACGGSCSKCSTAVSRSVATETAPTGTAAPDGAGQSETTTHLVDSDPGPGQMTKAAFLAELQSSVTATASVILAPTGWTADNCPDLVRWFGYYQSKDADHVERAIHKYAPGTARAESARDYIPAITSKVQRAVLRWTFTGEVTGVPEEATTTPGAPPVPSADEIASTMSAQGSGEDGGQMPPVQRAARDGATAMDGAPAVISSLGEGQPLDGSVASRFGTAFGGDFSHVRLHTGGQAATAASALGARAFTYGHHIGFDSGEYQPGTPVGDAILAHELAHVEQQRSAAPTLGTASRPNAPAAPATAGRGTGSGTAGPTGVGSGFAVDGSHHEDRALEHDADRAATGAIARLWTAASDVANGVLQAPERLRTARPRLQRCDSCGTNTPAPTPTPTPTPGPTPDPSDYLIEGLPKDALSRSDEIFFERNQDTIPASEANKIHGIANPTAPQQASDPLALFGYASEDETNKSALAQERLKKVKAAIAAASPSGASTPTTTNRHGDSAGRVDYREVRMVETVRGTTASPPTSHQPACQAGTSNVVPCTPQQQTTLNTGATQGATWITQAITKINANDPQATALMAQLFNGGVSPVPAATKTAIVNNLTAWAAFVGTLNQAGKHECLQCGVCETRPAHFDRQTNKVVLCPSWLDRGQQDAIATLVHEAGHGTPGVNTKDHAYRHTRRILALSSAEALQNTDSYVLLIRKLNGHSVNIGPATPDDVSGLSSSGANPETVKAQRALAWTELHLVQAYQLVNDAYDYAKNCRDQGQWISDGGRTPMAKVSNRLPGISTPGAVGSSPGPTADDQHALAAIHDRYHAMRSIMHSKPIRFVKGATDQWAPGPGDTVTLSNSFFALTPRQQLDKLLELIVHATPNISSGLEPGYVQLIEDLRQVRGVGSP